MMEVIRITFLKNINPAERNMNLSKVISTELGALGKRLVKVLRYGKSDVQTPTQAAPYGIDSNPVKDMIAVYCATGVKGKPVVLGYLNKDQLAGVGEIRFKSTDEDGAEQMYLWLKNDGTMEVGGDADFMVRYSALETAYNELQDDVNTLKQVFSAWAVVPSDGGAALKTAAATWYGTPLTSDISDAKIEEIKTL